MTAYKFTLQALLDLRIAIRNQHRNELAEAIGARQKLATQRTQLAADLQELRSLYQKATSTGPLDVRRLVELQQYEHALQAREQDLILQEQLWTQEIEHRQAALADADRGAKVIQQFGERRRQEQQQLAERQEAKQADDHCHTTICRNKRVRG